MSRWGWALMALSGQCGSEMSLAGIEAAIQMGQTYEEIEQESSTEIPQLVFKDDGTPVLKPYYDAQPG